MRFIGAFLITYFLSRGFRALGFREPSIIKLIAAHALSLAVIFALLFALRSPLYIFHKNQLIVYLLLQPVWLGYDLYRSRLAFWRAPTTPI